MPDHPLRGAYCAVLASLMFALMGVAVRYSSATLPNEMVVFLRNVFGLMFLLPWILRHGFPRLATQRLSAHVVRALSGLSAMYCFFYAIAHLQLAKAVLLNYSSPLFIAIIALVWLKEKASTQIMVALALGFIGICFILKPDTGILNQAAWVGLLSALFAAISMVSIRDLSRTEPTMRIVFYFSVTATLVSAVPILWVWQAPSLHVAWAMAGAGLAATLGQLFLTYSYSQAPAPQISPYTYSTVVFAAISGWIFWDERPDVYSVLGALLVISAGIITLQRRSMPRITEPD
ncbi:MAG: DMT family transporter [Gammaproteobacteria bacterium]